ncbi:MAG: hypothetical protein GXO61_00515 [Epsilonproteobacteria bacterium]|nr:hypothetical protein [Campylobacterota bacterium]
MQKSFTGGQKFSYNFDMELYKEFIEKGINPFIIFDSNAQVLDYNDEGEYILSVIDKDELFNLAVSHASMRFGFKHSFLDIDIGHSSFCALTVGYLDSDMIGIMLHKNVCSKRFRSEKEELQFSNIFTLIDIAINTNLEDKVKIVTDYDVSIPEFKINIARFLQLLNKIFQALKESKEIKIKVAIATGRSIKIENRKYQVIVLEIQSSLIRNLEPIKDEEFIISFEKDKIHIELPFIT